MLRPENPGLYSALSHYLKNKLTLSIFLPKFWCSSANTLIKNMLKYKEKIPKNDQVKLMQSTKRIF